MAVALTAGLPKSATHKSVVTHGTSKACVVYIGAMGRASVNADSVLFATVHPDFHGQSTDWRPSSTGLVVV